MCVPSPYVIFPEQTACFISIVLTGCSLSVHERYSISEGADSWKRASSVARTNLQIAFPGHSSNDALANSTMRLATLDP